MYLVNVEAQRGFLARSRRLLRCYVRIHWIFKPFSPLSRLCAFHQSANYLRWSLLKTNHNKCESVLVNQPAVAIMSTHTLANARIYIAPKAYQGGEGKSFLNEFLALAPSCDIA